MNPLKRKGTTLKRLITAVTVGFFAVFFAGISLADDLTVTYTVPEVSGMIIDDGDGIFLDLAEPAAGSSFEEVTGTFSLMAADNTGAPKKITVNTSAAVPAGLTLTATAAAGLGTPEAEVTVSDSAQDLITAISRGAGMTTVTIGLTADLTAVPAAGSTMTLVVTFGADS
jgi:hypothetical protein